MKKCKIEYNCVWIKMVILTIAWDLESINIPWPGCTKYDSCLRFIRIIFQFLHSLIKVSIPLFNIFVWKIIHFFNILNNTVNIRLLISNNRVG